MVHALGFGRADEVILSSSIFVAEEMGVVLKRSAYSPNIKDRQDYSCAILDDKGRLVAQAEHIPVHLGSMAVGTKNVMNKIKNRNIVVEEGDVLFTNDPYISGTHMNDFMLLKPVFYKGELVGFLANKAHHVDIGGRIPGSIGGDVREFLEEGIVVPVLKIVSKGKIDEQLLDLIKANVRTPTFFAGDLKAQIASLNRGEKLLLELVEKYGFEIVRYAWNNALDYTERYFRNVLGEMVSSTHVVSAVDFLESPMGLLEIRAKVEVSQNSVVIDFSGTHKQVDFPLNAVFGVTVASSLFALKSVLDPDMPMNQGFERIVSLIVPEGSLVNPRKPAPVSGGNVETSQRIVDVILKALSKVFPERVPAASAGTMSNVSVGGIYPDGSSWAFYETIGGGSGGRPGKDGVDGVHTNMTNTLNTPIEVLENYYPILFTKYKLREDSEGPGKYRGGLGIIRAFKALMDNITVTIFMERTKTSPYGLMGGKNGKPGKITLLRNNGEKIVLKEKTTITLMKGDEVIIETPGGGGYGDPCKREIDRIIEDLNEKKISLERAAKEYCYNPG